MVEDNSTTNYEHREIPDFTEEDAIDAVMKKYKIGRKEALKYLNDDLAKAEIYAIDTVMKQHKIGREEALKLLKNSFVKAETDEDEFEEAIVVEKDKIEDRVASVYEDTSLWSDEDVEVDDSSDDY